jgi:acetyl esterase
MTADPCFSELLCDPRNHVRPLPPEVPLETARAAADKRLALAPKQPVDAVRDLQIPLDGRNLACRLYLPRSAANLPVVIFFHGGGWVWGSLDSHDSVCRSLVQGSGCAVLSVAYRLSPEAAFPAALNDCLGALDWVRQQGATLGLDPLRIALCGDSSGANLALATALRTDTPLRHLGLFYPPLDPSCQSQSQHKYADNHLLTREGMLWFWQCYQGTNPASPLADADLSRLPPTSIGLAQCDILHDEGADLHLRLNAVGISSQLRVYPGMIHAFISLPHITPVALTALGDMARDIADAL